MTGKPAFIPTETRNLPVIKPHEFLVNELFFSVQGEGPSIGLPAVFLRLHLCNLQCIWCDTKYTWDPQHPQFDTFERVSPANIVTRLETFPCRRLVITGGEPLMQAKAIETLVELLPDWAIEIETNGTFVGTSAIRERCQLNVSPKLPSAGNNGLAVIRPDVLQILRQSRQVYFKFVVANEQDFDALEKVVSDHQLPHDQIIVMPEGRTQDEIIRHALTIIERAKARGYRVLPRLHVMLWGERRGV
ncbi:MAG: 7-carboxy-7-deazaguanine synthase QueE [Herpetosiphon sp.]